MLLEEEIISPSSFARSRLENGFDFFDESDFTNKLFDTVALLIPSKVQFWMLIYWSPDQEEEQSRQDIIDLTEVMVE